MRICNSVVVSSVFGFVAGIVFRQLISAGRSWRSPTGIARGYSELDWSALGLPSSAFAGA